MPGCRASPPASWAWSSASPPPTQHRWRAGSPSSAPLQFAYPGIWLRDDVYAIHGHYADVHATVPTFERLAAGTMARFVAHLPQDGVTPDDYEAVLSPLYAWLHALTQRADHTIVSRGGGASSRSYTALTTALLCRARSRSRWAIAPPSPRSTPSASDCCSRACHRARCAAAT